MSRTLTFLVVEDESIIALAITMQIKRLGHCVGATVPSGEEALAALEAVRPDLVLMDIHLSGEMDGIETARRIRERGGPPVAYITAYNDQETRAAALATTPLAFLPKPVGPPELIALARQVAELG